MKASSDKAALRRETLARRDALDAAFRIQAARDLAAHALPFAIGPADGPVSGFWPIRSEIDPRPLMQRLAAGGCTLALPAVGPDGLVFRRFAFGDALAPAGFGLSEPHESACVLSPRIMLVPLAAFDRRGHRIGYGAGHYDRAIARYAPALTIGLAFAVQDVAAIPYEPHDRPLDWILTERETIQARRD
jgi:5-formyltetrahydrofolate cyclo-ligase